MHKKIFLLGGSGYVGSQILRELEKKNKNNFLSFDTKKNISKNHIKINISSKKFLDYLKLYKPKIIINCATNSAMAYKNNLKNSINKDLNSILNLFWYLKKNSKCKLIYFSSSYVYSGLNKKICYENDKLQPTHNFGISKIFFENLIFNYHKNTVIFRLSSVFGPGKSSSPNAIYNFIQDVKKKNKIFIWGTGKRKMQYVYMDDVIKNVFKSFTLKPGIYNLGSNEYVSVMEIANLISIFFESKVIFKKKREGETLPFMSIKKTVLNNRIKFTNVFISLNRYLKLNSK